MGWGDHVHPTIPRPLAMLLCRQNLSHRNISWHHSSKIMTSAYICNSYCKKQFLVFSYFQREDFSFWNGNSFIQDHSYSDELFSSIPHISNLSLVVLEPMRMILTSSVVFKSLCLLTFAFDNLFCLYPLLNPPVPWRHC